MATVYVGAESHTRASGGNVTVHWFKTTNNDISVVNSNGTSVANWGNATAVNASFFAGSNKTATSFAINNSSHVTSGTLNWEDPSTNRILDFMMDPVNKSSGGFLYFGNGYTFPLTSVVGGNKTITINDVRWGLGGMDLELANQALDDYQTFRSQWKWRDCVSATDNKPQRTAIGYAGGSLSATNYIVAIFTACEVYDVRKFLKGKGCTSYGLNLDGGGSTQGKFNGNILLKSTDPSPRGVPTILAM